jgi:hypothetical protein
MKKKLRMPVAKKLLRVMFSTRSKTTILLMMLQSKNSNVLIHKTEVDISCTLVKELMHKVHGKENVDLMNFICSIKS